MTERTARTTSGATGNSARTTAGRGWQLAFGIVWIICGVLAILLPYAAALAANVMIGALLIVGGAVQLVQAIVDHAMTGRVWQGLIGLLAAVAGIVLIAYPLTGILTLTVVLALFFIFVGVARAALTWQVRDTVGWGWLLFSGLLGVVVGTVIWLGLPGSAVWALGLVVGIELLFAGLAMVMIASGGRRIA